MSRYESDKLKKTLMNKRTGNHLLNVLLTSILVVILAGCTGSVLSNTPTPLTPYLHYTPTEESNIYVEFDYPSSCIFSEQKIQDTDFIYVGFADPRFLNVPTRAPNESHGTPSDFGSVSIVIWPSQPGKTPDTELASRKQNYGNTHWMNILADYKIQIDGSDANVLEYQINDPETYTSLMFARDIYFMVNDRLYEIRFTVAEHERGGEFEKDYEYFFDSLRIIP